MGQAAKPIWSIFACIAGLYLFARGFLLSRRELPQISSGSGEVQPLYRGAVLLLIDALSFDFVDPSRKMREGTWAGNMRELQRTLERRPDRARLFKFKADPPTTTLQRLKGLTTGSFPTFIDASQNFDGSTVTEDNLLLQMTRANRSVLLAGDDTWLSLFPSSFFKKAFPFPSFDVMDLDSVDNGVRKHLLEELPAFAPRWPDVAIGHLLGVDHCGHRFGPAHPEMRRKLGEADALAGELLRRLPPDRLLIVFGDHGMTASGDHGGDSDAELEAGLFVFAPLGLLPNSEDAAASMDQVDLVPTLAALLGLPIPFSSLGRVSPAFFPNRSAVETALRANLRQVGAFMDKYAATFGDLSAGHLSRFQAEQQRLLSASNNLSSVDFEAAAVNWLTDVKAFFRDKWTRFDLTDIASGIFILTLTITDLFFPNFFSSLSLLFFSAPAIFRLGPLLALPPLLFFALWNLPRQPWRLPADLSTHLPPLALFAGGCGIVFSNSFIVEEALALNFLLQTLLLLLLLRAAWPPPPPPEEKKRAEKKSDGSSQAVLLCAYLVVAAVLRQGLHFGICREEQLPGCRASNFTPPVEKLPRGEPRIRNFRFIFAAAGLIGVVFAHRTWLRRRGHLNGWRVGVLCASLLLPIAAFAAGLHIFLQCLSRARLVRVAPVRLAMGTSVLALLVLLCRPLLIFLSKSDLEEEALSFEVTGSRVPGVVPLLWRHLKRQYEEGGGYRCVTGLPTLFSAAFTTFYLFCLILCLALLGDGFLFNLVGLFLVVAALSPIVRHAGLGDGECDFFIGLFLALLAQFYFYALGHQPTLSNIPWQAAFVGFRGNHPNYWLPTLFVCLNLFASFVLTAFLLPLTLVSEFSQGGQWLPFLWTTNTGPARPRCELTVVDSEVDFLSRLRRRYRFFLACSMCLTLSSMYAAAHHRRHLMVWKIFAPRMMLSVLSLSGTLLGIFFGYFLALRICQSFRAWQNSFCK